MPRKLILPVFIAITALIYGLPNILMALKLGENYQPLIVSGNSPTARDEAFAYAPFVNQVNKGNFLLKDAYVAEYSNYPTPFTGEAAPAILFALISALTGSPNQAFIFGDFVLPTIIFCLLFYFTKLFVKDNFYAASVSFLATIARDFIAVIPNPQATFQYLTVGENTNYLLYLSRAFHPQLTLIFFMIAVLALIKVVKEPKNKIMVLSLGLATGILFYSYVFYWTYFLMILALTGLYLFATKDLRAIRSLAIATAIALLIGSFYIQNMFYFYKLPLAQDFIDKSALHNLPLPLTVWRYFLIALLFATVVKLKSYKSTIFFFVLLSGVLTPLVSRFILGQDLETFHYLRRALMPFATLAFFIIFYQLAKTTTTRLIISLLIIFYALFMGLKTQIVVTGNIVDSHVNDQYQQAVFSWLNTHTPKNSTVGSLNTSFNSLLPVYTANYVYYPPTDRTLTPTLEEVERFSVISNLLEISLERQNELLIKDLSYMFVYQAYVDGRLDTNSPKKIEAENKLKFLSSNGWKDLSNKYKLDYIVITPSELPFISPNKNLRPLVSISDYIILDVVDHEK